MNWWEQMMITVVLGILHSAIKNPATLASLRTLLLGLADEIDASYGIAPPAHT